MPVTLIRTDPATALGSACMRAMAYGEADEQELGPLREETVALLVGWGISSEIVFNVRLVLNELYTNVVRHTPVPRRCTVIITYSGGILLLRVVDSDPTVPPPPPPPADEQALDPRLMWENGRGLTLVRALADEFDFAPALPGTTGKTAEARWRVA